MSFNVLVIPEDFRKDEHLLRPILQKLVETCRPQAKVRICHDPLLGGIGNALKWAEIEKILARYRDMVHCFLLIVDRDGNSGRRQRLDQLEQQATAYLEKKCLFFAENAWQEVEIWALAGMSDLPKAWAWNEVRQHPDPKEAYFDPYAKERELHFAPFGGRQNLGLEAARNYPRIRSRCPEDIGNLEQRLCKATGR